MSTAITGVILAGGEGRRMGGADKGLQLLNGRPLVAHVLARVGPQVNEVFINANRHHEQYAALGHPVIADMPLTGDSEPGAGAGDARDGLKRSAGPLAGMLAGFGAATRPLVLFVPCDMPALPADLTARLSAAIESAHADVAVAATAGRTHHVVLLARREAEARLSACVAAGGRKAGSWHAGLKVTTVAFDDEAAFVNINTPEELASFSGRLP